MHAAWAHAPEREATTWQELPSVIRGDNTTELSMIKVHHLQFKSPSVREAKSHFFPHGSTRMYVQIVQQNKGYPPTFTIQL